MKKKILIILLCEIVVLGITGCVRAKKGSYIGEKSDVQILQNDVILSIKDGTLKNTGAILILKNDSNKLLRYGEDYKIEINQNNEWHEINAKSGFLDILLDVEQNESVELELKWEYSYGKLAKGKYRIVKEVYFEDAPKNKFYIAAEFNLEY